MRSLIKTIFLVLVSLPFNFLSGQIKIPELKQDHTLNVYLEGEVEDFNFTRRNLSFINFVNDPKIADIHVITTDLYIASGGRKYFLAFYSGETRGKSDFTLYYIHNPGDTDDINRIRFTKTLKIGLLNYLSQTNLIDKIEITYKDEEKEYTQVTESEKDPWDFWVFRLSASGGWDLEESKTNLNYSGSIQADRITDTWLFRNRYEHENSTRRYIKSDDEVYKTINISDDIDLKSVYALSRHWSAGLFFAGGRSTYINTDFFVTGKPAIEYNFFDWKDADHKIFTVSYMVGPAYYKYRDTTFLDRLEDRIWDQDLRISLELIQPWGEVDARLSYSGYLNDLQNYNLSGELDISFRITKGLSVFFEVSAESVHDQLYLPRDEISVEELLLNSRKLPTTYEFGGDVGLRFYFGSLYNNIVNQRL